MCPIAQMTFSRRLLFEQCLQEAICIKLVIALNTNKHFVCFYPNYPLQFDRLACYAVDMDISHVCVTLLLCNLSLIGLVVKAPG